MMTAEDLPPAALQATREFAARVAMAYPTQQTILFGSRARGTANDESDADVAVVLAGKAGNFVHTKMAMNDIAYDILLSIGIRIQPPACLGRRMVTARALFKPVPASKHHA